MRFMVRPYAFAKMGHAFTRRGNAVGGRSVDERICDQLTGGDGDHGQIYSRFGCVCDLTHGYDRTPGGANPLFGLAGIREMFSSGLVKIHPDAGAFLQDVANMLGHGSLRRCKWVMRWS